MSAEIKITNTAEARIAPSNVTVAKDGIKKKMEYSQIIKIILSVVAPVVLVTSWQIGSNAGAINPSI